MLLPYSDCYCTSFNTCTSTGKYNHHHETIKAEVSYCRVAASFPHSPHVGPWESPLACSPLQPISVARLHEAVAREPLPRGHSLIAPPCLALRLPTFSWGVSCLLCVKFSCWSESQPCGSRIGLSSLSVLAHKIASAFLFRSRRNEAGRQTIAAAPNEYMHRLYWPPHVITDLGPVDGILLSCLAPVGGSNASYSPPNTRPS